MRNGNEKWRYKRKIKKQNKEVRMIKHNCNKARNKRYDYQCFTYEKEMVVIKFQFCPSSKIYFGELL